MPTDPSRIASDLAPLVQGDVYADIIHRAAFSTDSSSYRILPQCVVAPKDRDDVVAVVRYAAGQNLPVAPRGAGSGLAGESLCSGIVLDMTRYMKRIRTAELGGDLIACEPGVVLDELNKHLAQLGRKIGPDPSSANRAAVGGCLANNATGAHSLLYGHMGGHVRSVEAVLADGRTVVLGNARDVESDDTGLARDLWSLLTSSEDIIRKGTPASKRNRCGYNIADACHGRTIDLARLMAGSEGTLAIFTSITLATVPLPKVKGLLQLEFHSHEEMARTVPVIMETRPAACELMDHILIEMALDQIPQYRDILPAEATAVLLIEHTGDSEAQVRDKIDATDKAVGKRAFARTIITRPADQARIWKSRKDAAPLLYRKRRREHAVESIEDTSVDHTRLAEYIAGLQKIEARYGLQMAYYGHAGDGELHLRPNLDLGNPNDVQKWRAIAEDVFSLVWSLGGTISGEHAAGLIRADFVRRQYGDAYCDVLRQVKKIFDPAGLLNPGKILNDDPGVMTKNLRRSARVQPEKLRSELLFEPDELSLEYERCFGCGLCLGREPALRMCPVYRAMGDELGSSRAKANLLNFWATGQLKDKTFESADFRKFLDLCVNCKMCERDCPSGVKTSTLMAAARAEYVRRKGLRRTENALSHNRYLSLMGSAFSPLSNVFMKLGLFKWAMEVALGLDRRRSMPAFLRGSFLKSARRAVPTRRSFRPIDKVAYFVDTYANFNDHELGFAVLDVLRHNDIEVVVPDQRPAPLPSIVYGDVKTARKDLAFNVKQFAALARKGYTIVCSEPSAALCLKDELRHYIPGDDAKVVSKNTVELMSYLWNLKEQGKLKTPEKSVSEKFAYHLPCHLCALGDDTVTLRLLRDHFHIDVTDLKAGCCGLSGTFGMQAKNYDLSMKIADSLQKAIESSPTQSVLTECAACKMQIEHIAPATATHPIKLIAQAYGL
jgi:anaerobic glycerol-3-phosphate dehydrogenase C subunit